MDRTPLPNDQTLILGTPPHEGNRLACPGCAATDGTHVDTVRVAARREDAASTQVSLDAITGKVAPADSVPVGETVGEGRRHRIVLDGRCELCDTAFSLIFTQHKGVTFVEWALDN